MSESTVQRKRRAQIIYKKLDSTYPKAGMMLAYKNPWELTVSVVLSAQCTDKKVNEVTAELFKKYRTLDDCVHTSQNEFEKDIYATGFYRQKAKNILASAKKVKQEFGGKVPGTMEELLTLPGVARKTANIILGNAFKIFEGIAVDTHVRRLSQRLGFTTQENPEKIEQDLMALFSQKKWFNLTYLLIEHGRAICASQKPKCDQCLLAKKCPAAFMFPHFK
ncbi:MAG: endonuclease III [Candidatus Kerfeldbacteria bacterium]